MAKKAFFGEETTENTPKRKYTKKAKTTKTNGINLDLPKRKYTRRNATFSTATVKAPKGFVQVWVPAELAFTIGATVAEWKSTTRA